MLNKVFGISYARLQGKGTVFRNNSSLNIEIIRKMIGTSRLFLESDKMIF